MSRILLVDDDLAFRSMLRLTLTQMGYEVTEAGEGEQALGLYAPALFDVVVTDLIMPGKEGIETIIALRKLNPAVKIIAMSGGGRVTTCDYLQIARQVGAKKLLVKPFSRDDIRNAIEEVLAVSPTTPASSPPAAQK
jgi:CheY-like chemotaxis protein